MEKNRQWQILLGVLFFGSFIWYFFGGGSQGQATKTQENVYQQVASDAVAQYNIAKNSGNKTDACVHAGLVAASFLQAQNDFSYSRWKDIQKADCAEAGMPAF
jgi:hypothetical protein